MATDEQIRQQLIAVYPASESWKKRVMKMNRSQLFAILQKFRKNGAIKT